MPCTITITRLDGGSKLTLYRDGAPVCSWAASVDLEPARSLLDALVRKVQETAGGQGAPPVPSASAAESVGAAVRDVTAAFRELSADVRQVCVDMQAACGDAQARRAAHKAVDGNQAAV